MSLEVYIAYTIACFIVLIIPGPTILLVVGYALSEGRRAAWHTVSGVALGDLTAMVASFAGMGALLAASATAFAVLKYVGAAYLVYLGIKMWRAKPRLQASDFETTERASARRMALHAYAVTALNPKSIVFFIAFLPQFIDPARALLPQLTLMGVTFLVLAIVNAWAYGMLAGSLRERLTRPRLLKAINRTGGSVLIGAGVLTAIARRA